MASASDMIKRFREGRPTSRAERDKERNDGKVNEMWWLPKDNNNSNNNGLGSKNDNNYEPHYEHRYPGRDNTSSYRDNNDIRASIASDDDRPQTRGDRRPMGGAMRSRNDHLRSLDLGSSWGSLGEDFMTSTGRDMVDRDVGRGIRVGTKGDSDKSRWFEKRPGQMQEPNYVDNSNEFQPMWRMRGRDGPGDSLRLDKYKPAGDEFGRQSMEDMLRSSGSTGLKGLLMKELKLDTRTKEGPKDKKNNDYDDYDYNYNSTFDTKKNTAEVSAAVTNDLNILLKSLQDADELKMKEYSEKKKGGDGNNLRDGEQRTSIADVANRLEAEMKGFKILFDEKKEGTFSEKSQKERDTQMREAGKLEALSMLDDLIDRGSYSRRNNTQSTRNYLPNQNILQGIDMNVGMVQTAIDKEIMAAKDTLQQMYMIKRNLARGLNQADHFQFMENNNRDNKKRDCRNQDIDGRRRNDRDSRRRDDRDIVVRDQESSYQRKDLNDNYRPQSISKISQNIETTLDEVIFSLKARLSKPPVSATEVVSLDTKPTISIDAILSTKTISAPSITISAPSIATPLASIAAPAPSIAAPSPSIAVSAQSNTIQPEVKAVETKPAENKPTEDTKAENEDAKADNVVSAPSIVAPAPSIAVSAPSNTIQPEVKVVETKPAENKPIEDTKAENKDAKDNV